MFMPPQLPFLEIFGDKLFKNKRLEKFSSYFKDFDITNLQEIFEL